MIQDIRWRKKTKNQENEEKKDKVNKENLYISWRKKQPLLLTRVGSESPRGNSLPSLVPSAGASSSSRPRTDSSNLTALPEAPPEAPSGAPSGALTIFIESPSGTARPHSGIARPSSANTGSQVFVNPGGAPSALGLATSAAPNSVIVAINLDADDMPVRPPSSRSSSRNVPLRSESARSKISGSPIRTSDAFSNSEHSATPPSRVEGKCNDMWIGIVYLIMLLCALSMGIYVSVKSNFLVINEALMLQGLKIFLVEQAPWVWILVIIIAYILGIAWIFLLGYFAEFISSLTMCLFIVGNLIGMFICASVYAFAVRENSSPSPLYLILSIFLGLMTVLIMVFFCCFWRIIKAGARIIKKASRTLRDYPSVLFASFLVHSFYIGIVVLWIFFYDRLFLLESSGILQEWAVLGQEHSVIWHISVILFGLMFLWTSSLLSNIQMFIVSGVVLKELTDRHKKRSTRNPTVQMPPSDTGSNSVGNPIPQTNWVAFIFLKRALTQSFGSLCAVGFIVALIRILHFIVHGCKRLTMNNVTIFVLHIVSFLLGGTDLLIVYFSKFCIALMANSSESFWRASCSLPVYLRADSSLILSNIIATIVIYFQFILFNFFLAVVGSKFSPWIFDSDYVVFGGVAIFSANYLIIFGYFDAILNAMDSHTFIDMSYARKTWVQKVDQARPSHE